jgi:predicted DNA-binding transcriptional regulator AlpA
MKHPLPETGFIRLTQLLTFIPFSKSTVWLKVRQGTFPAPVKLSVRVTAWRVEDIREYIEKAAA